MSLSVDSGPGAASRASLGAVGWLARILGLGDRPGDTLDTRVLRRAMAVLAVFTFIASGVWIAMGVALDRPLVIWTSLGYLAVVATSLAVHARTHWFFGFVVAFALSGLMIAFIGNLTLGGVRAGAGSLIWGFLVPIGGLLYFGLRGSLLWFATFVVMVVVAMLLDPLVRTTAVEMPYPMELAFNAFNLLGACAVVFALLAYVDRQRRAAQARSEALLLNVLPASIAERLKSGERVIAEQYADATVLFADLVDFTPMAQRNAARDVVNLLNDLFSAFDAIAEREGLEKIKTIGDAYMAVAGVPVPRTDHAQAAVRTGLAMLETAHGVRDADGAPLELRVGIASGPLVAGVIGRRKFIYDLWGDTVKRQAAWSPPGCRDACR